MTREEINKLKGKRAALITDNRKVLDTAKAENRTLTADEETAYENRETQIDAYEKDITRWDAQLTREHELNQVPNSPFKPELATNGQPVNKLATKEYYDLFFNKYLRKNKEHVGAEVFNALEVGTDAEGGYLVPEEWAADLIRELPEIVVMRKYARTIQTRGDRNLPVQTSRGAFTWIAEEGSYSTNDPVYNNLVISAHKVGGIIVVSDELVQDNQYDLAGHLRMDAIEEFADKEEDAFIDGNNTAKPEGIFQVTAVAGVSVTGTTGSVSATPVITFDNVIDTYHGLARKYRTRAAWIMSDGHVKLIRKLKDGNSQYIWQPSLQAGEPDRLLNKPVEVSDSAPVPATGSRGICFGDWGYYTIVDRLDMQMKRLDELYAATGQVGFRFNKRLDGHMTMANAMTYYAHGADS